MRAIESVEGGVKWRSGASEGIRDGNGNYKTLKVRTFPLDIVIVL